MSSQPSVPSGDNRALSWRNWPVPEPFVAGLFVGLSLHVVRPLSIEFHPLLRLAGGGLLLVGLAGVRWAVLAVGPRSIATSTSLVTAGPYRYSRNPMYVSWTGIYLGLGLLTDVAWLTALFPIVAGAVHLTVRREEGRLEERFGADYRRYRREVPRYLGLAVIRQARSRR